MVQLHELNWTQLEKKFINSFSRIQFIRKHSKIVSILLSKDVKNALNKLVSLRGIHVAPENDYLFAAGTGVGTHSRRSAKTVVLSVPKH